MEDSIDGVIERAKKTRPFWMDEAKGFMDQCLGCDEWIPGKDLDHEWLCPSCGLAVDEVSKV